MGELQIFARLSQRECRIANPVWSDAS